MKRLTDQDIADMIGAPFTPDDNDTRRRVRRELKLSQRIPKPVKIPTHTTLDLHMHTIEQAWGEIMEIARSGTKTATIITGASGILKIKFQEWVQNSLLTPYIVSCTPLNNGSFAVKFRQINS
ncbi:MAG: Smr/MutS family protein [Alphaproteobacteria bacterium]|nr:Smr/MutS family protein [Alphaproteobacteria bacterium]